MTEREALNWEPIREFWRNNSGVNWDELEAVIKEALAQPAQEPVVCIGYWNQKTGAFYKPDQLSSAHQKLIEDGILRRCYINSPQRTWVGLTIEDVQEILNDPRFQMKPLIVHAVEAKLKEKNA